MAGKIYIPEEVKDAIRKHIMLQYPKALEGFFSANEDEDTLTGDLGGSLRISNQKVIVRDIENESQGEWIWGITYTKFRGRGVGATEAKIGADGIFELSLRKGKRMEKKSLPFQAKTDWQDDPNLIKEAIKLSTWREASFVLNYTATVYQAIDLDSVIASRGKNNPNLPSISLDSFIGNNFLDCKVGDTNLRYDAISRKLIWQDMHGEIVATKFSIPRRLSLQVVAPRLPGRDHDNYDREIPNERIHDHRMNASDSEILSIGDHDSDAALKKARDEKAKIYHTDKHDLGEQLLRDLMNARMQEINNAYDRLKPKNQ